MRGKRWAITCMTLHKSQFGYESACLKIRAGWSVWWNSSVLTKSKGTYGTQHMESALTLLTKLHDYPLHSMLMWDRNLLKCPNAFTRLTSFARRAPYDAYDYVIISVYFCCHRFGSGNSTVTMYTYHLFVHPNNRMNTTEHVRTKTAEGTVDDSKTDADTRVPHIRHKTDKGGYTV